MRISDWSSDVCSSDLVGGVILLVGEDVLEHDARRGIVVAEIADQLLIMFDHQAFGDQIVLDHLHEIAAVAVFGRSTAGEALRIKIGHPAELVDPLGRSEEHTSELQSLMRISYAVFCLKKKNISIRTE